MKIRDMILVEPRFLGAGGGGSVWAMKASLDPGITGTDTGTDTDTSATGGSKKDVVVKISWSRSTDSVRNECFVLNAMEQRGVSGVERCLGVADYRYDSNRIVIAMEPLVEDNDGEDSITSSLEDLSPEVALVTARKLATTMAQMIAAGVVTTDVQPLISRSTGDVLLIDMTEARVMATATAMEASSVGITDGDKILTQAFCTELLGLIPEALLDAASEAFWNELRRIETNTGVLIPGEIRAILSELPIAGAETFS